MLVKLLERILPDDLSSTLDNFREDVRLFNQTSARLCVALEKELDKKAG